MSHLNLSQILKALKSPKLAGKIVSGQELLWKEGELLDSGSINRELGVQKQDESFALEDVAAARESVTSEKYIWRDQNDDSSRANDKFMDAKVLIDYLLLRLHDTGALSLVEANAKFQAFKAVDDLSALVIDKKDAPKPAPQSISSTYVPFDVAGAPRAPTRPVQLESFDKITAVQAFQDAARASKLVAVSEFNRVMISLRAQGGVSAQEYNIQGHKAFKTADEIMPEYTNNAYVLKSQLLSGAPKPEVFVNGVALAFAMASETLSDEKARLVVKAFDLCPNRRNLGGLVKIPN